MDIFYKPTLIYVLNIIENWKQGNKNLDIK